MSRFLKKIRFTTQNQRDEWNKKYKEIEERVSKKKLENWETYNEAIKEWLPPNQRKYAEGNAFLFLCKMLKNFLEKNNFQEDRMALKMAKEHFDHYCQIKEMEK